MTEIEIDIFRKKVQGLYEMGVAKMDASKLLKRFDGDMLLALGYEQAIGLCVNVRSDREAWNRRFAEDVKARFRVTDDYKILPL